MLDTPLPTRASEVIPQRREPQRRRDPVSDLSSDFAYDDALPRLARKRPGWQVRLRGSLPQSIAGRIAATVAVFAGFGALGYGLYAAERALLHDQRLIIPSSSAIQITGNNHLTKPQLLSVFGEDVERNILTVPLEERRRELEALPWVEHATVMRMLPDHIRVAIVERTPVAFVRQGGEIGLVDAHGVLLDLSPELEADHAYSFPVVSGIAATDLASTRARRMKVYMAFLSALDAGPEKVSARLSEVDVSDQEDVRVLMPSAGGDILVHFGKTDFLARYQRYMQHLPDWKSRYPKLASVDMRYEHEVVLEMAPGATVPIAGASDQAKDDAPKAPVTAKKAAIVKQPIAKPAAKPAAAPAKPKLTASPALPPAGGHLQQSFDVQAKPAKSKVVSPR